MTVPEVTVTSNASSANPGGAEPGDASRSTTIAAAYRPLPASMAAPVLTRTRCGRSV